MLSMIHLLADLMFASGAFWRIYIQGDRMKIGLLMMPFVCAVSVAMAAGEGEPAMALEPSGAAHGVSPAHYRVVNSKRKVLPSGDMRQCLELKTGKDIIRCSETRRQK
ncbi:MAG: hypothetical protein Q8K52_03825 [Thiobacillus sp.]|nr:hypothetical protein [Thiobacillus sp.]